jgi:GABA permease
VVANQTLASQELWNEIRKRLETDANPYFYVLVPNTAAAHYHIVPAAGGFVPMPTVITGSIPETDEEATARAQQLLDQLLKRLRQRANAEGELGDADPFVAIQDVLATRQFDEILVSTLPGRSSRWRRADLPGRVQRRFGLPVTNIVAKI